MKERHEILLLFSRAGMELSWLYAWSHFLTISLLEKVFPLHVMILSFGLAAALTALSRGRGWRVFQILMLHMLGLVFAAATTVHAFYYPEIPFPSRHWWIAFFQNPRTILDWLSVAFVLLFPVVFWFQGVAFVRRPRTYWATVSRFDGGLAAFFLLFLTRFLVRVKGGTEIDDPLSYRLIFPFFPFGLLAVGLARDRSEAERDFLPGYLGVGTILGFALLVLAFGSGIVFFFHSYLTLAAHAGYKILKGAAEPLGPVLIRLLRVILMPGFDRAREPSSPPDQAAGYVASPAEPSAWTELLEKILIWGMWVAVGLGVLVLSSVVLFYLARWLVSKTPVTTKRRSLWFPIASRLIQFLMLLLRRSQAAIKRSRGRRRASAFYTVLLSWGRLSGLPHLSSETPSEYGLRLEERFPNLRTQIERIVEAFNQEVYGEAVLSERQLSLCDSAWRRLRSPLLWYCRARSRFQGSSPLFSPARRQAGKRGTLHFCKGRQGGIWSSVSRQFWTR